MEGVLFLQMSIFAVLEVFQTLYMRPMYHYIVSSRVDFLDHPILKGRYYNSMLAYTLTFISLTYVLSALMVLVLAFQSTFGSSDQHVFLVWCILLPLLFLSATTQFFVIVWFHKSYSLFVINCITIYTQALFIFITGGNAMRVSVLQPWFQKVLKGSPYYWSYATVVYVFLARSEKPQINSLVDLVTPDIITYFLPRWCKLLLGMFVPLSLGAFYCIAATIAFYRETRPTKLGSGVQGGTSNPPSKELVTS